MSEKELLNIVKENRNVTLPEVDAQVALNILIDHFLGKDYDFKIKPLNIRERNYLATLLIMKKNKKIIYKLFHDPFWCALIIIITLVLSAIIITLLYNYVII